ncbi:MAG: hypothetical protein R3F61_34255 [Myxococcota bacterium]
MFRFLPPEYRHNPFVQLGLIGGAFLVGLMFVRGPILMLWTATLPSDAPTTTISEVEIRHSGRSTTYFSYLEVDGQRYWCAGAKAPRGTVVAYDPQTPTRCRQPEYLWSMMPSEQLSGLVCLFVAIFLAMAVLGRIDAMHSDLPPPRHPRPPPPPV